MHANKNNRTVVSVSARKLCCAAVRLMWCSLLVATLLLVGGTARAEDAWFDPVRRLAANVSLFDEDARPYSTPARPREISGEVSYACEHGSGDPCGDGLNGYSDLDSQAGYG